MQCVKHCIARHQVKADQHYILNRFDVRKEFHADYDKRQARKLQELIESESKKLRDDRSHDSTREQNWAVFGSREEHSAGEAPQSGLRESSL